MSTGADDSLSLDLGRATNWMFRSQNWLTNIFWLLICTLLSMLLIGSFVTIGYQLEILQKRSRGGGDQDVDFIPERFGDYLVRGLVPMAVYFLASMVIVSVVGIVIAIWATIVSTMSGGEPEGFMVLVMIGPILVMALAFGLTMFLIVLPLAVRAGLTNDFAEGFKLGWAIETAKMMWPTMLLALVYVMLCAMLAHVVGMLMCLIGVLVTGPWVQLVMSDLGAQIYDIYLAKGGQPLHLAGEPLQAEIV